jgi:hypothetical protein
MPDSTPAEHEYEPTNVHRGLQAGVHAEPLGIDALHVPSVPLPGATTEHGFGLQATVPDSTPAEHEYEPTNVHPTLQAGVHAEPLGIDALHVPSVPLPGATTEHGFGLQATVSDNTPAEHERVP